MILIASYEGSKTLNLEGRLRKLVEKDRSRIPRNVVAAEDFPNSVENRIPPSVSLRLCPGNLSSWENDKSRFVYFSLRSQLSSAKIQWTKPIRLRLTIFLISKTCIPLTRNKFSLLNSVKALDFRDLIKIQRFCKTH